MNRTQAVLFLPLITALAEGKTIQINGTHYNPGKWVDVEEPTFTSPFEHYRIKPNPPRVFYIAINKNPALPAQCITEEFFNNKSNPHNFEYIKVEEVL